VDTGAERSVLPHSTATAAIGLHLQTANGAPISTWGVKTVKMKFSNLVFLFDFVLADVPYPILGADFLSHHRLTIDPHHRRILHQPSNTSLVPTPTPASPVAVLQEGNNAPSSVRRLLAAFPTVFTANLCLTRTHHGVQHHIETTGPPVFAKARRLDATHLHQAKEEFRKLEKARVIRRSNSPWSSPLHLVPKPDGSWRPCGDYRRLNFTTTPDHYPLPNLKDFSNRLHKATVFSKLDLVKGHHQVPIHPADIPKTAVITPFVFMNTLPCRLAFAMLPKPFNA